MSVANGTITATQFTTAAGKILAFSPNGSKIILSDTQDTPQQVFVFDTGAHTALTLPIVGATAAAFSPDGLKAYIVAGSTLYVYSQQDALQTVPLAAPATDVAFNSNGMLGYLAGGDPAGVLFGSVCDGSPTLAPVASPNASLIRELPNGSLLTLSSSNQFGIITPAFSGTPSSTDFLGCLFSRTQNWPTGVLAHGFINVTNTSASTVNLGAGFSSIQLLVSSDGSRAYLLAPNLATILVYNIDNGTTSSIALAGNAGPVRGALVSDGSLLFVLGTDRKLHALDTATLTDTQQVSFPDNFCRDSAGNPAPFTCLPDLIAVTP
ncbi:MAG TPA: WD40 repeat domain-containing protein [Candidatus Angelobacter sp.]|nr:WD40 repeat domain-containing protein [Candidatus Angelobacter sp.]